MIDFELPQELIAQEPARPRDSARLLVYDRRTKQITDSVFSELPKFLTRGTTLVVNNSKVEHCRWLFPAISTPANLPTGRARGAAGLSPTSAEPPYESHFTVPNVRLVGDSRQLSKIEPSVNTAGKAVEIFVLEKLDTHTVRALVRPGRKFRLGARVQLADWLGADVTAVDDEGIRTLKLSVPHNDRRLRAIEHVPLPPYIAQNDELAAEYQTIYAKPLGSKAAPTAGLHFTDELMNKVKAEHEIAEVTLHVGLGTFAALNEDNFKSGKLHEERYEVRGKEYEVIKQSSHVTAVGTTSARTLEAIFSSQNLAGSTDIFIQPGYAFRAVDSLITNFHLPGTSLLLMVEALVGSTAELQRIYDHAIAGKYRFYSFGDAMLIL